MGQLHFFDEAPARILDARASVKTSCLVIPRDAVLRLLEQKPKVMRSMLRAYSRWIRQRDLLVVDGACRNLTERIVTKLLQLSDRYGETSADGAEIRLRLTETTLANLLGASRENVSRSVAQLARRGDVRRARGLLILPRPDDLRMRYSWIAPEEAHISVTKRSPSSG